MTNGSSPLLMAAQMSVVFRILMLQKSGLVVNFISTW